MSIWVAPVQQRATVRHLVQATPANRLPLRERVANTLQWDPARNTVKRGVYAMARARGRRLLRAGRVPEVANIFTAMTPKSGSQWAKALFDHEVVRAHTGLFTLPQLDFEFGSATRPFPAATFVPGLYASYEDYLEIPKPYPHRTAYIFRDPRDIVVSGYYSAVNTHRSVAYRKAPHLESARTALRTMSLDLGLRYMVEILADQLVGMASWVGVEDENVALFRLEDISADPEMEIGRMLEHCGVHLDETELGRVLSETSREALQQKDLARREAGSESHYRVERRGHGELLKAEHYRAIDAVVPGLIENLGYPPSPRSAAEGNAPLASPDPGASGAEPAVR